MNTEMLNASNENEIRTLSVDEIDAIEGGALECGCVRNPYEIVLPGDPIYTLPVEPIYTM